MSESDEGAILSATRQNAGSLVASLTAAAPPLGAMNVPAATTCASTTVVLGSESEPARRSQATADTDGLSAYPGARNKRAQTRPVNAAVRMGAPWRPAAQRQYPGSTPLPGERCRRL